MLKKIVVFIFIIYLKYINCDNIDNECLGCICDVLSDCKTQNNMCINDVCGVFRITLPYWQDANRIPASQNDDKTLKEYKKCTTDIKCASDTVNSYISMFSQDCNNDERVDCYDHFAIHVNGGYDCAKPLPGFMKNKLKKCLNEKMQFNKPISPNYNENTSPNYNDYPTRPNIDEYTRTSERNPTTQPSYEGEYTSSTENISPPDIDIRIKPKPSKKISNSNF